jgi:thiopurine S-methyltransferase
MEADFWHQKWKTKEIGFHQSKANPLLVKFFKALSLEHGTRIFVPLCGKTLDIAWLLSNGYQVVGSELSEIAIQELFLELAIKPEITIAENFKQYSGPNIDIFVGDFFNLSTALLGHVDAIYDRAALIALPESMRQQYTSHLIFLTEKAPQLLICLQYDQTLLVGPPFSIDSNEVNRYYNGLYKLSRIESIDVAGGLKGKCDAKENVWLLLNN